MIPMALLATNRMSKLENHRFEIWLIVKALGSIILKTVVKGMGRGKRERRMREKGERERETLI